MKTLRIIARSLCRRPAFTLAVVLTLALGIGATTAVFSVVSALLLRPLPYADPSRLVAVWPRNRSPIAKLRSSVIEPEP